MIVYVWQTKKRFAKEWAEAEKATQQAEKIQHDLNATKLDVEKVKSTRFHLRVVHMRLIPQLSLLFFARAEGQAPCP